MKVRCFNIQWDTSTDSDELATVDPPELPCSDWPPTETVIVLDYDPEMAESEQISDRLSEIYGFCHFGFDYEVERYYTQR